MRSAVGILLVALLASGSATAAEPWDAPPLEGDPRAIAAAAAALTPPPGADADVLLEEHEIRIDGDGRRTMSHHLIVRVLSDIGVTQWGTFGAWYTPWRMQRPLLRARSISPAGEVNSLDSATLVVAPAKPGSPIEFDDARVLRGPVPGVRQGSIVETLAVTTETAPVLSASPTGLLWLGGAAPRRRIRASVEATGGVPLRARLAGTPVPLRSSSQAGKTRFEVELESVPGETGVGEKDLPPDALPRPQLRYSAAKSWNDVAASYAAIVDAQLAGSDLRPRAKALALTAASREEAVRRAYIEVRKSVRYTAVELGSSAIVPRAPDETLRRGYGDCKDLSTLLVGLLRAAGIESYVALISAASAPVAEELPGFQFDHAIVYVPGNPAIWVDPTVDGDGSLPPSDQDRAALVAQPRTRDLLRTPDTSRDNLTRSVARIELAESGPARLTQTFETHGAPDIVNHVLLGDAQRAKSLGEFFRKRLHASALKRFEVHAEPGSLARSEWEFEKVGAFMTASGHAETRLDLAEMVLAVPESLRLADTSPRRFDVYLRVPVLIELQYRFQLPAHWSARPLPEGRTVQLGPVPLREELSASPGEVVATFTLDLRRRRFSPQEATAFREALRTLQPILLRFDSRAGAEAAAGRLRSAIEEHRSLIALHPSEAVHHAELSFALLSAGAGEEARAEARRAVELEPASAFAHLAAGWAFDHDGLGRLRRRGFDQGTAIAEYRKGKELDPDNYDVRRHLAATLELDATGVRFGSGAALDAAASEYQAIRKDLGRRDLDDRYLAVQLQREQFDAVLRFAGETKETAARDAAVIAAIAAQRGATAALEELARRAGTVQRRTECAEIAARALLALRRHALAAELYSAASEGSSNAERLQRIADLLRKTHRREEHKLDTASAADVVRSALVLALEPQPAPARLDDLVAAVARKALRDEHTFQRVGARIAAMHRQMGLVDVPTAAAQDLLLAELDTTAEGDSNEGFRVTARAGAGAAAVSLTAFLAIEDGRPRVLCIDTCGLLIGEHVLSLADAGRLSAAARFLTWQRTRFDPAARDQELSAARAYEALWAMRSIGPRDPLQGRAQARALASVLVVAREERARAAAAALEAALDGVDARHKPAVQSAIVRALATAKDAQAALGALDVVARALPRSAAVYRLRADVLSRFERWPDVTREASERLASHPDDPDALGHLAQAMEAVGDLEGASRLWDKRAAGSNPGSALNNAAWNALVRNQAGEAEVAKARRAVDLDQRPVRTHQHTLAALQALTGHVNEARQTLFRWVDVKEADELDESEWLLAGLVAEGDGLPRTALGAYAHIASPPLPRPLSTAVVARQREKALNGAGPTPRP